MESYFIQQWRRNQLEDALWKYCVTAPHWGADPYGMASKLLPIFSSRIKKLLNLDRAAKLEKEAIEWVFYNHEGRGRGSEDYFSDFHVFTMWIALRLFEQGFDQLEVIRFLRCALPAIKSEYGKIRDDGRQGWIIAPIMGTGRQRIKATKYPDAPSVNHKNSKYADFAVYMTIKRMDINQTVFGATPKKGKKSEPLIMHPEFHYGLEAMKNAMFTRLTSYTAFAVLELADAALSLPKILQTTPPRGKGQRVT